MTLKDYYKEIEYIQKTIKEFERVLKSPYSKNDRFKIEKRLNFYRADLNRYKDIFPEMFI